MGIETIFCYVFLIVISFFVGYSMLGGEKNKGKDWTPTTGFISIMVVGFIVVVVVGLIIFLIGKMIGIN
jgi:hypothetical protein